MKGRINQATFSTLKRCKPNSKLSIFVSSTFTDTYRERAILQEEILPALQIQAKAGGMQVLLYDMRFGVKDENTNEHSTWDLCQEAIRQCHEERDERPSVPVRIVRTESNNPPKWKSRNLRVRKSKDKRFEK